MSWIGYFIGRLVVVFILAVIVFFVVATIFFDHTLGPRCNEFICIREY